MNEYSGRNKRTQLGVLSKYWLPGMVKTRLMPYCGDRNAAALHRLFLTTTLSRFASAADRQVLSFYPEQHRSSFAKIANGQWDLLLQQGENLGGRIANSFQDAFSRGPEPVLLIGADTPHLPSDIIKQAFTALRQRDLVFVLSDDGGYCLIGASRPVDPLMLDIEWGTSSVWAQTKKKIDELNWSVKQLSSWYDIDQKEDLVRLMKYLADHESMEGHANDPALASLSDGIKEICAGVSVL